MKKLFALMLALVLAFSMTACGGSEETTAAAEEETTAAAEEETTAAAEEETTAAADEDLPEVAITFANMLAPDHPQSVAVETVLCPEISEMTGGKFTITGHYNGELGSDAETTEATIMGTMAMTGPACATISSMDPNWYVLDVPYVFTSAQHARAALDGDLGQFLSDSLEQSVGLVALGFGESGMRHISNDTKEIKSPEDLAGMKIRVLENKYHIATFESYGANPTPMAFAEVYTALQTGQIDGQDNPITITCTSKFYEVQHYYSLIGDLFCGNCILVNAEWFHALPESYQEALRIAVHDTITEQRRLIDENEAAYLEEMTAAGVTITELSADELQAFIDATQPVRDSFAEEYGEVGQQMLELAAKYQ